MDNSTEVIRDNEKNISIINITPNYSLKIVNNEGKPLVNKSVICHCTPHPDDFEFKSDEYREFLMQTDENGYITLNLDDYYMTNLEIFLANKGEIFGDFKLEYLVYNNSIKNNYKNKLKNKSSKNEEISNEYSEEIINKNVVEWNKKQEEYLKNEPESIAIELKNISINFKVTNDKIDNLKEYIIRTLKRNKSEVKLFKALDDISIKIHKGEKVGLIGYNGAGKSTLLKIISRVYDADEGEVIINGNIAPLLALGAGFDKNYSGRENIFLNGAILGYDEEFLKNKYDEIVEYSTLGDFINLPVKNYSAGMKSKLGFSIATLVNPDILILDEVLGVGDITFRKKSREKIMELMESGTTVLLVSHSIGAIRDICDTAIWIDHGKLRDYGEVNEICDKYVEDAKNASKKQLRKQKLK